jgi:hypothetical protein
MSISLATKDFVQGGLLTDVDVFVKEAQFTVYDYDGKATVKDPPLALKLVLNVVDDDTEHTEYITAGSSRDFVPCDSDDGETIEANGSAKNLRKGSNLFLFNESLEKEGFPQAKLVEGKASNYAGMKFHIERRPAPKRQGLKEEANEGGYEKTFIACGKLISTKWDKSGQKGQKTVKATAPKDAAPAAEAASSGAGDVDADVMSKAGELAMQILSEQLDSGKLKTAAFKMQLFKLAGSIPQNERNELAKVATSADVLGALGWVVKGDEIVLG